MRKIDASLEAARSHGENWVDTGIGASVPALEATQGQMDGFFGQLLYKCHLDEAASVGDWLEICPQLDSRVARMSVWLQLRASARMPPLSQHRM